jgi:hypothetical protein
MTSHTQQLRQRRVKYVSHSVLPTYHLSHGTGLGQPIHKPDPPTSETSPATMMKPEAPLSTTAYPAPRPPDMTLVNLLQRGMIASNEGRDNNRHYPMAPPQSRRAPHGRAASSSAPRGAVRGAAPAPFAAWGQPHARRPATPLTEESRRRELAVMLGSVLDAMLAEDAEEDEYQARLPNQPRSGH